MDKKRKLLAQILIGFFIIMMLCTVLSRAASSVLVAQVDVAKIKKGRLTFSYEGEGTIVPNQEMQIFLWSQQQIEKTAKAGSTVKAGECLVQFKLDYLEQAVKKKQAEVEQLRYQKEQQEITASGTGRVPIYANAALTLESAQVQLDEAIQKESQAQADYDAAIEGDDLSGETNARYQALESAKAETQAAKQAFTSVQNAYNLACQEEDIQRANDAKTQAAAELGVQGLEVQLQQAATELMKLQEYQNANGKINAAEDCVVLLNGIEAGTITTGSEVITVGIGGWKLKGTVSEEDMKKLSSDTKIEVSALTGGTRTTKIQTLEKDKDQTSSNAPTNSGGSPAGSGTASGSGASGGLWYAPLPEGIEGNYNQTFQWKAKVETEEEYEQKLSLNALREGSAGTYCLVLSEESTMLGIVQKAKKINVKVIEKDGENAAIMSELGREDQIIISSEKYVEEGDQVRIRENEN